MKTLKKEYVYRDVNMLTAAKTAACNFKDNVSELSKLNPKWDVVYADDLLARIDEAHNNHLGYDVKKELRDATSQLREITAEIKINFKVFKCLVAKFYKGETEKRNEIFNVLGFKQFSQKAVVKTQSGLISLLYAFKTNLSVSLRKELLEKGIPESIFVSIAANSSIFLNTNSIQEVLKGNTAEKVAERKALYNAIFREVSSMCVVASAHFRHSATKQALFNFEKIAGITAKKHKQDAENNSPKDQHDEEGAGGSNP